ncbi:hypothetical protein F8M41_014832 [Gigaspora margarita]|uniref:Uncharacterized protein n=1 Tax=Gigaspora margarita TaxID=4874 RepID=A0A8H4ARF2_GIGMA|nr:hypothetical protein F8M41_014832 [Gigaspora margarita]
MPQRCQQVCCQKGAPLGLKDSKTPHYCATHKPGLCQRKDTMSREWLLQVSSFLFLWINSNFMRHSYERRDDSLEGQNLDVLHAQFLMLLAQIRINSVLSTNN